MANEPLDDEVALAGDGATEPEEGFVAVDPELLPEEVVEPDAERDPDEIIRSLVNRLRQCNGDMDRYYEKFGPLPDD